jgi:hypothetical protein
MYLMAKEAEGGALGVAKEAAKKLVQFPGESGYVPDNDLVLKRPLLVLLLWDCAICIAKLDNSVTVYPKYVDWVIQINNVFASQTEPLDISGPDSIHQKMKRMLIKIGKENGIHDPCVTVMSRIVKSPTEKYYKEENDLCLKDPLLVKQLWEAAVTIARHQKSNFVKPFHLDCAILVNNILCKESDLSEDILDEKRCETPEDEQTPKKTKKH